MGNKFNILTFLSGLAYSAAQQSPFRQIPINRAEFLRIKKWAKRTIEVQTMRDKKHSHCVWIGIEEGKTFFCPSGYQAMGFCGGGPYANCNGYFFELQCCNVNLPTPDSTSFQGQNGKHV